MTGNERLEFIKELLDLHKYIGEHAPLKNAGDWQKSVETKLAIEFDNLEREQ